MYFYSYTLYNNQDFTLFNVSHASAPRLVIDDLYIKYRASSFSIKDEYDSRIDSFSYKDDFSFYPMAVRYADPSKNLYVIERPPFQIDLDFSTAKSYRTRRSPKYLVDAKMWIPWTVSIIYFDSTANAFGFYVFFNNKPLSSFSEYLVPSYLPNTNAHGSICLGQDSSKVISLIRQDPQNITDIYNQAFNDYFAGWNSDLSPQFIITPYLHDIINNDISVIKKAPKFYKDLHNNVHDFGYVNSNAKYLARILYTAANLSLEQVFEYIDSCKHYYDNGYNRYTKPPTLQNVLSLYLKTNEDRLLTRTNYNFNVQLPFLLLKSTPINYHTYNVILNNMSKYPDEPFENYINNPYIISKIYQDIQSPNSSHNIILDVDSVIQYNNNTKYNVQGDVSDVAYTS